MGPSSGVGPCDCFRSVFGKRKVLKAAHRGYHRGSSYSRALEAAQQSPSNPRPYPFAHRAGVRLETETIKVAKYDNYKQAKDDAKETAKNTANESKDRAQDVKDEVTDRARDVKDKVGAQAEEAKKQAGEQAKQGFDQGKGQVVSQISSVAQAFRKTSEQLREEDQGDLAGYTERIAEQVERVSDYLEGKGLRGVAGDLETLARQRPGLFVGGALVVGLVAARFLRSGNSDSYR